jgi:hypothetical protein
LVYLVWKLLLFCFSLIIIFPQIMKKPSFFSAPIFVSVLFAGLLLAVSGCQTALPVVSGFRDDGLQVKQAISDEFTAFNESKILGRVSYNDSAMQVQLKIDEPRVMMRLLLNGLTVWVDSTASRRKEVGVVFPAAGPVLRQMAPGADRFPARERDADQPRDFDPTPLLEVVQQRNKVFQYGQRAEFVDEEMASMFLDEEQALNYLMIIPFSKLGIRQPENVSVSVGVASDVPTFEGTSPPREPQPGIRGRPGYPYQQRDTRMRTEPVRPIESWIIFTFGQNAADTPSN